MIQFSTTRLKFPPYLRIVRVRIFNCISLSFACKIHVSKIGWLRERVIYRQARRTFDKMTPAERQDFLNEMEKMVRR